VQVVAFLPLLQKAKQGDEHLSPSVIVISSMSGIMSHAQGVSYDRAKKFNWLTMLAALFIQRQ